MANTKYKATKQYKKDLKNRIEKYIKSLKLKSEFQQKQPITMQTLGMIRIIPGAINTTGVRLMMAPKAVDTSMTLNYPQVPLLITGIQQAFAEASSIIKMECDGYIHKKIKVNPNKYILIYEHRGNIKTKEVKNYIKGNEKFGVTLKFTKEFLDLKQGDTISQDTVLADCVSVETGIYTFTRNVPTLLGTFNESSEDSEWISEELAEHLEIDTYETFGATIKNGDILINLYGKDPDDYSPLPRVGDKIRDDGAIIGKRESSILMAPSTLSDKDLMEFDSDFDKIMYLPSGGGSHAEVVDVEIFNTSGKHNEQLKQMIGERDDVYSNILSVVNRNYNSDIDVSTLKFVQRGLMNGKQKQMIYKGEKIICRVNITVRKRIKFMDGMKMTGLWGNKGIGCKIVPTKWMPIMDDGTRIHRITEAGSVGNRNNSSVATYGSLNVQIRQVRNDIRAEFGVSHLIEDHHDFDFDFIYDMMTEERVEYCWNLILDFLEILDSPLYGTYLKADWDRKVEQLGIIVEDEFRVIESMNPSTSTLIAFETLNADRRFRLRRQGCTLNFEGKPVRLKDEVSYVIAEVLVQNKIPSKPMATTTPYENHYELPTKLKGDNKQTHQNNYSGVSFVTAADMRLITGIVPTEGAMEFIEQGKSSEVRNYAYGTLLRHDTPSCIEKVVDRNVIPFGQDSFSKLYQSVCKTAGFIQTNFEAPNDWHEGDKFNEGLDTTLDLGVDMKFSK